ncbi:rhodanese-like domain-containing protein [Pseudohongiella sp.]|uniref:Rhodanese domain-containing protein n=1 Tax=marine sediment metagenome TaxID=412755 RepID=A0A0F9W4H1_9ZZZZ|nr:rhodanese-like domain-containing protein [Pseudohongiella sp.]HDZ09331.1 rhodanese-like domain-containing protein [Pseudohongiella sp.]HEA63820.1 rhodanese-like domain-containing protein [Pseudohongiella sp.]
MEQILEFIGNNVILVGVWIALALALIIYLSKSGAQAIGPQQAVMLINRNDGVVLDIRDKKDYDTGHIVDSVHIPHTKLSAQLAELEKLKSRPIIVVCKMGQHSGDACKMLLSAGFEQVVRLRGGMAEWRGQNLPLVQKAVKEKAAKTKTGKAKAKPGKNKAAEQAPAQLDQPDKAAPDETGQTELGQKEVGQEEVRQDDNK